jgi:hypothetical protein
MQSGFFLWERPPGVCGFGVQQLENSYEPGRIEVFPEDDGKVLLFLLLL